MSSDAPTHHIDAHTLTRALTGAATAAGYAPSIHHSQPWRWRLIGRVLDLHLDRDRVLHATDPDARLATLSCGVALHHARVALAARGWRVTVVRLPDRVDLGHLAQIHVEGRAPVDRSSILDLRTIPLRHTDRRPTTGEPVGAEQVTAITAAVAAESTWLHTLTSDQVLEFATVPVPDLDHHGELSVSADHGEAVVFVMLHGRTDEPHDWLRAGEALSAGWLTASRCGVSVQPHSAPIESVGTRQALRVMLAGAGYPYLLLRLGRIDPGPPHPPRPPVQQNIALS